MDPEQGFVAEKHMLNTSIQTLAWRGLTVRVRDNQTKQKKNIIDNIDGFVSAGECCALMGPSGSGKTTVLNALAGRSTKSSKIQGSVFLNGARASKSDFRQVSGFVGHREALIGGLTCFETLDFASRLASPSSIKKHDRLQQIHGLLKSFGLAHKADTVVGTPLREGISDGQKKRLMVAKQLVTSPRILFLDEPTSGLDSAAAFEIIQHLQAVAKRNNLIVVCSIHQPSASTFNLFDKALLIGRGKTHYFGPVANVFPHYEDRGLVIPPHANPAEFLIEQVNMDFSEDEAAAESHLERLQSAWEASSCARDARQSIAAIEAVTEERPTDPGPRPSRYSRMTTLLHRDFVKSYRDPLAYGIRFAFAVGFAFLLGTVWFRLDHEQESIEPLISEIYFAPCFMSLAAIIYAPAFIGDYTQYIQDFRNGLYGAPEFAASNFLIGLPFLFGLSLVFSIVCYWLSNQLLSATAFFTWVLWIFLATLATESLIVLTVSIFPNFMFAMALALFNNSVLLCTQGFFIKYKELNSFYKYGSHYGNYLAYTFEGLMVNQFSTAIYTCGKQCRCLVKSALNEHCQISGEAILGQYGYVKDGVLGRNVGILMTIILTYRLASLVLLSCKK